MIKNRSGLGRFLIYVVFVAFELVRFRNATTEDLSVSYLGCRLLADGQGAHLYDYSPVSFALVGSKAWALAALAANYLHPYHPYVQTPLWAWSLKPLCLGMSYPAFNVLFMALELAAFALTAELFARAWTPKLLAPRWMAALLALLSLTTPFVFAMCLGQTHILFLCLTVAAMYAASRDRPMLAGTALAVAAAVKITPGLLIVYWLVKGEFRAAGAFAAVFAMLLLASFAACGPDLMLAYFASMRRVSEVLLVAGINQSIVAWLGYQTSHPEDLFTVTMLPMAAALKGISLGGSLAGVALAGYWARRFPASGAPVSAALIAITALSPIAWAHYFVVLCHGRDGADPGWRPLEIGRRRRSCSR